MTAMIDDSRRSAAPGLTPPLDGPGAHGVWVAAAFLLVAIARETLRDPDATGRALRGRAAGAALTHGETRVLHYLPTNLSAREIACELYLSVNTVKTHQRHVYQKLGAGSRSQAVERARALGLLTSSSRQGRAYRRRPAAVIGPKLPIVQGPSEPGPAPGVR